MLSAHHLLHMKVFCVAVVAVVKHSYLYLLRWTPMQSAHDSYCQVVIVAVVRHHMSRTPRTRRRHPSHRRRSHMRELRPISWSCSGVGLS